MSQKLQTASGCALVFPNGEYSSSQASIYQYPNSFQLGSTDALGSKIISITLQVKPDIPNGSHTIPSSYIIDFSYVEKTGTLLTAMSGEVDIDFDSINKTYSATFDVVLTPQVSPTSVSGHITFVG